MGFEEKTPDLLALLMAHVGGSSLAMAIAPQPPTPATTHTSPVDAEDKKRKRAQGGKSIDGIEEGEPKKSASTRTSKKVGGDQLKKASI